MPNQTRENVITAAWSRRNDPVHRMRRIRLRERSPGQGRQRGRTCCKTQKSSAGRFMALPRCMLRTPTYFPIARPPEAHPLLLMPRNAETSRRQLCDQATIIVWTRVGGDIANGPSRQLVRRGRPSAVHDIWHRSALCLFRNISSLGHRAYLGARNFPSYDCCVCGHGTHFSEGNRIHGISKWDLIVDHRNLSSLSCEEAVQTASERSDDYFVGKRDTSPEGYCPPLLPGH